MLLVADIHLGIKGDDDLFLDQSKKLFVSMVEECIRRDTNEIIILGDFFDNRKSINVKTLNVAIDIVDMLKNNNINTFFIIGNHDTYYRTEIKTNSIRMFKEYKNVTIVDSTMTIDRMGLVSWNQSTDANIDYLIGHFEINGFPVTESIIFEKSNVSISDFQQYKRVISGHFHIPSTKDNITYLGSPYQLTFNDTGSMRGFYSFNDGKLTFIEFTESIKFVNVYDDDKINPNDIKGNIVKLIFKKDHGYNENQKIIDSIQSYEPVRFFTHFDVYREEVRERAQEMKDIKNSKDILFDFIKLYDNPSHINPEIMMNIVNELLEDVK